MQELELNQWTGEEEGEEEDHLDLNAALEMYQVATLSTHMYQVATMHTYLEHTHTHHAHIP